jgi:hypothetical protein
MCTNIRRAESTTFVTVVGFGMGDILLYVKQNGVTRYLHTLQVKATEQELLMPTMEINYHCVSVLSLSL